MIHLCEREQKTKQNRKKCDKLMQHINKSNYITERSNAHHSYFKQFGCGDGTTNKQLWVSQQEFYHRRSATQKRTWSKNGQIQGSKNCKELSV
jgi:hypothetical protein